MAKTKNPHPGNKGNTCKWFLNTEECPNIEDKYFPICLKEFCGRALNGFCVFKPKKQHDCRFFKPKKKKKQKK